MTKFQKLQSFLAYLSIGLMYLLGIWQVYGLSFATRYESFPSELAVRLLYLVDIAIFKLTLWSFIVILPAAILCTGQLIKPPRSRMVVLATILNYLYLVVSGIYFFKLSGFPFGGL
jgi:hypothetical protein